MISHHNHSSVKETRENYSVEFEEGKVLRL
jgi:hypothetical protein